MESHIHVPAYLGLVVVRRLEYRAMDPGFESEPRRSLAQKIAQACVDVDGAMIKACVYVHLTHTLSASRNRTDARNRRTGEGSV